MKKKKKILVYTDGSSLGNPGKGGWAFLFLLDNKIWEFGGYQKEVTNNQMELKAIREALKIMFEKNIEGYEIVFFSDSKYCIEGINNWLKSWKKNNWINSQKKEIKNIEIWKELDNLIQEISKKNSLNFEHVKGHSGDFFNEKVDKLAVFMAKNQKKADFLKGSKI